MSTNGKFFIYPKCHPFSAACLVAVTLVLGVLAGYAQTGIYLFTGSETTITLNPGIYNITAYGAAGAASTAVIYPPARGGLGAEMEGQFYFAAPVNLTILVGGGGSVKPVGGGNPPPNELIGAGGGGGSFVVNGSTPLVIAGGGGGAGNLYSGGNGGVGTSGGDGYSGGTGGNGGSGGGGGSGSGGGGGGGYSGNGGNGNGAYWGDGGSSFLGGGYGGSGGYWGSNGGYGGGGGGGYGGGGGGGYGGGGGGDNIGGGGGGGSIIDSSAIMVLAEVSGIASPDGSPNGEIIITAVPEPTTLALAGLGGLALLLLRRQRK